LIVELDDGILDLQPVLTPDQQKFYAQQSEFAIHRLFYPKKECLILLSFQDKIIAGSQDRFTFMDSLKVFISSNLFTYIFQAEKQKVQVLSNNDILVSNDLEYEVDVETEPLFEEFSHYFSQGMAQVKALPQYSNLRALVCKDPDKSLLRLIYEVSLPYRLYDDDFLGGEFYSKMFKKYLIFSLILKNRFSRELREQNTRDIIALTLASHFAYNELLGNEFKKRESDWTYFLLKDILPLKEYAQIYTFFDTFLEYLQCEELISEIIEDLHLNPYFKPVCFLIARRIKIEDWLPTEIRAVIAIVLFSIAIDYYKRIYRNKLAKKYEINFSSINAKIFSILRKSGYRIQNLKLYGPENTKVIKEFIVKTLRINFNSLPIKISLAKEIIRKVQKKKLLRNFEEMLGHLLPLLEEIQGASYDLPKDLGEKEVEEFSVFLLQKLKERKGMETKEVVETLRLFEQIFGLLNLHMDLKFLYRHGFTNF